MSPSSTSVVRYVLITAARDEAKYLGPDRRLEVLRLVVRSVLITAATDEAKYLEATIRSVVSQTLRPIRWFIVSDGSTDGTDALAARYAREHKWIEVIERPRRADRNFAGKVQAFNTAYARACELEFDVIGN